MFKRIFLFLLTNLAILIVISITFTLLSKYLGLEYSSVFNWENFIPLLTFAAVLWFLGSFISLLFSKSTAKLMYNLKIVDKDNLHLLSQKERFVYDVVENISRNNNIKMPEVAIYESQEPNAFATWPSKNNSLVAVSTGLLDIMKEDELEWVIGHEMSHILNWDMVTMVLLQWVINTFVISISRFLAYFVEKIILKSEESWTWVYYLISFILEILIWILATIVVMWFSRYREFKADEGSAIMVWKEKMIRALQALERYKDRILTDNSDKFATMKIGSKKRTWIFALFSSHPDLSDRIKNLEEKVF